MKCIRNISSRRNAVATFFIVLLGFSACSETQIRASEPLKVITSRTFEPLKVNQVVMLPLLSAQETSADVGRVGYLSSVLHSALETGTSLELVPATSSLDATSAELGRLGFLRRAQELARHLEGKEKSAQGVLVGLVSQIRESDGSRFGAETPAALSFQLWLLKADSGEVLWSCEFDHQEHPLSDNLLDLPNVVRAKGQYRTSDELAQDASAQVASALEKSRRQ